MVLCNRDNCNGNSLSSFGSFAAPCLTDSWGVLQGTENYFCSATFWALTTAMCKIRGMGIHHDETGHQRFALAFIY